MSAFGARRSTQAASDSPATHTAAPAKSSNVGGNATGGRGQATSSTVAPTEASGYEFTQVPGWLGVTQKELSTK